MARSLQSHGVQVHVATTDDDGPGRHKTGISLGQEMPQEGGWTVRYFPKQTEFYKVSLPLRRWLCEHVADYDVVHVHALFSFPSIAAARAASRRSVPYIVRPLGVLNRWGMANRRRWVKSLSFRLLELPLMQRAAAMHYTSQMELQDAARFGLNNQQAVIPIGMDLAPFASLPDKAVFSKQFPATASTRNLLFLSRLDVKKGVELLLAAFALLRAQQPHLHLIICGDGEAAYVAALKQQAAALGLAEHITWTGFVAGELRLAAFAAAELFVLPSHAENFGIALLEAMAAGLPCVASDQVALAVEAAAEGAVQAIGRSAPAFATAISELLNDSTARNQLGTAAKKLAQQKYSVAAMGDGLIQLYNNIKSRAA